MSLAGANGASPKTVSWQLDGADCSYRPLNHRLQDQVSDPTGTISEYIQIAADAGTYVYAVAGVSPSRVIDELVPRVWLRADRPGIQILARVVLPRSPTGPTGQPTTVWIRGQKYDRPGTWQQLQISNVPQLVSQAVRMARAQSAGPLDEREAYVDRLAINVYAGPGRTSVWIGSVAIDGSVWLADSVPQGSTGSADHATAAQPSRLPPLASFESGQLLVDGRPFFPRVIDYHGESIDLIRQLGFNTIAVRQPPPDDLVERAEQLDIWLLGIVDDASALPWPEPAAARVVAWFIPPTADGADSLPQVRNLADQLRQRNGPARPIVSAPQHELWGTSRYVDILLQGRWLPNGSEADLTFWRWLEGRRQLARPGTPLWAWIETDLPTSVLNTLQVDRQLAAPPTIPPQVLRHWVVQAVAAGADGAWFRSRTPLDRQDATTHVRTAAMALANIELSLLEPWLAGGQRLAADRHGTGGQTVAFRTERSRLLVPVSGPGVSGGPAAFLVAGVPESSSSYLVTAGGIQPISHRRVAGGVEIQVPAPLSQSPIVITQDPLIVRRLANQSNDYRARWAQLELELAEREIERVRSWLAPLADSVATQTDLSSLMAAAEARTAQARRLAAAGDLSHASQFAVQAVQQVGQLRILLRDRAAESLGASIQQIEAPLLETLPWQVAWAQRIARAGPARNLLTAGDFEDLGHLIRTGWRQERNEDEGLSVAVSLSRRRVRSGQFALRLTAAPRSGDEPPRVLDRPAIQIRSRIIPVRRGQLVRVRGWAYVEPASRDAAELLVVYETIAGPDLAWHAKPASGWQQFELQRVANQESTVGLVIALSGLGEAYIDQVSIEILEDPHHAQSLSAVAP